MLLLNRERLMCLAVELTACFPPPTLIRRRLCLLKLLKPSFIALYNVCPCGRITKVFHFRASKCLNPCLARGVSVRVSSMLCIYAYDVYACFNINCLLSLCQSYQNQRKLSLTFSGELGHILLQLNCACFALSDRYQIISFVV